MNKLERFVYDVVKDNPRLKNGIKKGYQSVCDLVPSKAVISDFEIATREGAFFGFHDKVPFSNDDTKLLAMRFDIPLRMPKSGDRLSVGFYSGENYQTYHELTETNAWNWHQGCQLQWCGEGEVIFNDYIDGRYVSRVFDVASEKNRVICNQAIASVSPDGECAIGFSFERVNTCMPGYGYTHPVSDEIDLPNDAPEIDGLYRVNLLSGHYVQIVSIAEIATKAPDNSMEGARHYFSHAIVSPGGRRVMFLHRWIHSDVAKRWSRMVTCNLDGSDVYVFPTHGMVSHMAWKDADHILAYSRDINGKDGYILFRDREPTDWMRIGDHAFNSDGHPSFSPDQRWIVTDTYPDRSRRSYVALYDLYEKKRYNVAYLKHWKKYASPSPEKHWACDLHPRWNRAGTIICFDSVFSGKRSLCTVDVSKLVQQKVG